MLATDQTLRIRLFGGFRVTIAAPDDEGFVWRRRRAASIVKLLALQPGHKMHREQLVEALWPEHDPPAALNNLKYTLFVARRTLEPDEHQPRRFLKWQGDVLALAPDGDLWIDAVAFEQAAADARASRTVADYKRAVDLYTADLLPEDIYDDWTFAPRERLRESFLALLLDLAALHERSGELPNAIGPLERVIAVDRTHEEATLQLMRAYARSGQRHRALRLYRQFREALADELDVQPDPATDQLYGEVLAGKLTPVSDEPAPAQAVPSTTHNLRAPLTRFIGREAELRRVCEMLAESRLVTLTGAGGVGKTRLATATVADLVAGYPDGAWLVALGSIPSADAIPAAIAEVLGASLGADRDDLETLGTAVGGRRLLLVLDNCEHLIDGCARIAEQLLQQCPGLHILATSREPMHLPGEVVLRVPALGLPGDVHDVENLARSDSVQLFLDRARSVQPALSIETPDVRMVAEVCRRLDGLPFAIELAAARMAMFSVSQLAGLLSDPLHVLTGGSRTAGPRQQTLRATLDWSFGLLDAREQRLLARLSVFAGGWTLDTAEQICSGERIERRDVLVLLAQLVDKSLVEVRPGSYEARYRLLETVRQYASGRLRELGEESILASRHADFMLQLAEEAEPALKGGEQARWLDQLTLELDNVRAALHRLEQTQDYQRLLRLAAALVRMWWIKGYLNEGRRWLEHGLALAGETGDVEPGVLAKALQAAGNLARLQGDIEPAQRFLERCLDIQREHGSPAELADALDYLAALLSVSGDVVRALSLAEEGLELRRGLGDTRAIAMSLGTLGELTFAAGDPQASRAYIGESLKLYRSIGDRHSVAIALNNLGEALRGLDMLDAAAERFRESLALFQEMEAQHGVAHLHANLGDVARRQGSAEEARTHYLEALAGFDGIGYTQAALAVVCGLASMAAVHGRPQDALRLFAAEAELREAAGFALTPFERGDYDRAIAAAGERLSAQAAAEAWTSGQGMTFEDIVSEARALQLPAAAMRGAAAGPAQGLLSPRERQVALLIADGRTNREIAAELQTGLRTADKHVSNILRKLGLASRAEVRQWVAERGILVDLSPPADDPPTFTT